MGEVLCYKTPDLGSRPLTARQPAPASPPPSASEDPRALCAGLVPEYPASAWVACASRTGTVSVIVGQDGLCERLGLDRRAVKP